MKVYISKYRNHWLSPYTIMSKVMYWKKWTDPTFDLYDDENEHYIDWLVKPMTLVQKFLDFVHPKINYVKIDYHDTWNMDSTLALIILPMLKKLKEEKHGSPMVDAEDVPEELRMTGFEEWDSQSQLDLEDKEINEKYQTESWDITHKRWSWVLDELIWTFTQLHMDTDWEAQYHTGVSDLQFKKLENGLSEMVRGPKDTHVFDSVGYLAHNERINKGLKLFGKYYRGLWD